MSNILISLIQLAAVDSVSRGFAYFACSYAADLAVFSNSYFAQLSAFSGDLAVVAVIIANEQFAVTQCAALVEYAIVQNNIACGYVAVFIYYEAAVCTIECAVAVYEERHGAVFICSTYGQVVFCVQCIGLDGVYTSNVAFFIDSYLTKFSGFRSDLAVVAVIIANEQFAVTQCAALVEYAIVQNNIACGYVAVFIYYEAAVCTIECAVAVYEERHGAVFICSTYGQVVFCVQCVGLNGVCICITIFIYREFVACCIECASAVYEERHDSVFCHSTYGQIVFGIQCIGLNGVCIYITVFIYREFIVCCVEIAGAVYEERHNSVFCHSTYGQIVFGIQCIGLNGVYIDIFVQLNLNNFNAVFYILTYADILVTIEVNIIARLYLSSCCYSTINRQIPTFVSVIRAGAMLAQVITPVAISIVSSFLVEQLLLP